MRPLRVTFYWVMFMWRLLPFAWTLAVVCADREGDEWERIKIRLAKEINP